MSSTEWKHEQRSTSPRSLPPKRRLLRGAPMRITRRWLWSIPVLLVLLYGGLCLAISIAPCMYKRAYVPSGLYGGAPAPKNRGLMVTMESLDVRIRLRKTKYAVDATYRFFNNGPTTTQWVRIPKRGTAWNGYCLTVLDFIRFDAWINGRRAEISQHRDTYEDAKFLFSALRGRPTGTDHNAWITCSATFPRYARTTMRVSYEADYIPSHGDRRVEYVVGTASYWQGSIGRAAVTLDGTEIDSIVRLKLGGANWRELTNERLTRMETRDYSPTPGTEVVVLIRDY